MIGGPAIQVRCDADGQPREWRSTQDGIIWTDWKPYAAPAENAVSRWGMPSESCADPRADRYQSWLEYCYLWICECPGGNFIKIGRTNDPNRRFVEFKTSSPFKFSGAYICQVPDRATGYEVEQEILRTFRAFSTRGEWIALDRKNVDAFVAACTRIARGVVGEEVRFRHYAPRHPRNAWRARGESSRTR